MPHEIHTTFTILCETHSKGSVIHTYISTDKKVNV